MRAHINSVYDAALVSCSKDSSITAATTLKTLTSFASSHFSACDSSFGASGAMGAGSMTPYIPAALRESRNCLSAFDSEMQNPFETGSSGKSGFSTEEASAWPSADDKSRHPSSLTINLVETKYVGGTI